MAFPCGEIAKNILVGLFEAGRYAATGESSLLGVTNWRKRVPYPEYVKSKEKQKRFSQALWRLKKSHLIIRSETKEGFVVELTEKGKRKVREMQLSHLRIPKQAKWDGMWRIVIFDIPEKIKGARLALTFRLKALGFFQLQKSVWVHAYPCGKEIELLTELFGISPYVNLITAKEIKDDARLKKHFHLL
ncbi:MAG: phenylacetic acid degradation operon negative regulatory protein [Parcubacteria group bacterium Greene0714_21]|nr:MAG: phenylacetic acid degradation operon negative regulatory protein [Parcubacteria group bacterium Greene0416_39]TSC97887.1 MAG: phenylacetic acid degradation operon negative regulatory protein [Parcubacteria group bacterium Greene1014_47]TSD03918.1 MAG: phenylacetic acid degradation operon negative regulatory protein [Parcubacteria group bacterium Greene0714_21]